MPNAYLNLIQEYREISILGSIGSTLGWDQETYLPVKASEFRGEQASLLAKLSHERMTSPKLSDLAEAAVEELKSRPADDIERVNAEWILRSIQKQKELPLSLVQALAEAGVQGQSVWKDARKQKSFKMFAPALKQNIALSIEYARCRNPKGQLYDALLDDYEPMTTTQEILAVLEPLEAPLQKMVGRLRPKKTVHREGAVYPLAAQKVLVESIVERMGFDLSQGRLDVTTHPFCTTLGPSDVRLTTRYDESDWSGSFFSIVHEAGHGLYEQGLLKDQFGLAAGSACSMAVHESQSRFWENLVARSESFWKFFYPETQQALPILKDVSFDSWLSEVNAMQPSLIRTESDELTYNLHILIRLRLELQLISGDLSVDDLPAAWNQAYKQALGVDVPDDVQGCMQDVHWAANLFGYFGTYTLGNLYAAQIHEALKREIPDVEATIQRGDFRPTLQFLRTRIHQFGRRYRAADLLKQATGQGLSAEPLLAYLDAKVSRYG